MVRDNDEAAGDSPLALARKLDAYQRAMGLPMAAVAAKYGLSSRTQAAHLVRLLRLPPAVQGLLEQGRITVGHARALLGLPPERRTEVAREIIAKRLSVRQVEDLARGGAEKNRDPDVARLTLELEALIGMPVTFREGTVTFEYGRDLEVLDGLLARLGYEGD